MEPAFSIKIRPATQNRAVLLAPSANAIAQARQKYRFGGGGTTMSTT